MRIRNEEAYELVAYYLDRNELKVVKAALENPHVRAYIQTARTDMVNRHLLTQIDRIQEAGPDTLLTNALNEAYLKGALDLAHQLLSPLNIPESKGEG